MATPFRQFATTFIASTREELTQFHLEPFLVAEDSIVKYRQVELGIHTRGYNFCYGG